MGRGGEEETTTTAKMEIDLSLKIDSDDEQQEEKDQEEAERAAKERVNSDKEEVPAEATSGEIEDDASMVEISLPDNTKTKEVSNFPLTEKLSRSKSTKFPSLILL